MPEPLLLLPGILMPASERYPALIAALGSSVQAVTKELEVYRGESPPPDYSIQQEVDAVDRAADAAGFQRFHLYAHSGGGAVALAYTCQRGERLLSLALDEPACDFSPEMLEEFRTYFLPMLELPPGEMMGAFLSRQLKAGVSPPERKGPPPAWFGSRPRGVTAIIRALGAAPFSIEQLRAFQRPVYYSYGGLSHESWAAMKDRLAARFADFSSELYESASHMATSHMIEPERVASALRRLWASAS